MSNPSTNKQLFLLFFSRLAISFVGMGLFPLLPLYAAQFGATRSVVGIFFALIYVSNAAGPVLTGWLAGRVSLKGLFVAAGVLGIPALGLMGQATALWQVVALTSIVWFSGGVNLALINIFTGLYADGKSRGKSFGLMSLAAPLGALVGGAIIGQLVGWQGYGFLFAVLGAVWVALPVIGILGLQDISGSSRFSPGSQANQRTQGFGLSFYLLLLVSLLSAIGINTARLGTSMSMQALEFSPAAVASSATVSGLITIPVTFLVGVLSDRFGRRRFLMLGYLLAAGGALILSEADQLWHFWLAATLMLVAFSINGSMGPAMAADLLPPKDLNRGMSWFNTATSAASVMSFASSGFMMDVIGSQSLFLLAAALPVLAASLFEMPSIKLPPIPMPAAKRLGERKMSLKLNKNTEKLAGEVCAVCCSPAS